MEERSLKKEISLFMATMLVCGNMIGSGVFMLPSTLAQVSGPGATIIAWIAVYKRQAYSTSFTFPS